MCEPCAPEYNEHMENEPAKQETEIEALARIVKDGFDRMDQRFDKVDARFEAVDRRFAGIDRSLDVLNQKIDRVDAKLEAHREETNDGFAALRPIIGSLSHTVVDHEERLKALEGE